MLRTVFPKSKHRYQALRKIMSLQRKTAPIAPPVGYRHQCYCRMMWWNGPTWLGLLHHAAKTRSSNVSRRNDCERDFHRSAKSNRTSCGLYEWLGIASTIFQLDSTSPSNSLYLEIYWKFETKKEFTTR